MVFLHMKSIKKYSSLMRNQEWGSPAFQETNVNGNWGILAFWGTYVTREIRQYFRRPASKGIEHRPLWNGLWQLPSRIWIHPLQDAPSILHRGLIILFNFLPYFFHIIHLYHIQCCIFFFISLSYPCDLLEKWFSYLQ